MLKQLDKKYDIKKIIEQVNQLSFDKRLALNETHGNLFNGEYRTKEEFVGTPLGDVLADLGDIGEARLLRLHSGETYTAHTDPDDRYHLAITTNDFSYLIDISNEKMYHIPVDGNLWTMDTGVVHIAANFGGTDRIHLNIRHKLPTFKLPGYRVTFTGVQDLDWKQRLHLDMLGFINYKIKDGSITGINKINEREILINCSEDILEHLIETAKNNGFSSTVEILN